MTTADTITCSHCHEAKPAGDYYPSVLRRGDHICKICNNRTSLRAQQLHRISRRVAATEPWDADALSRERRALYSLRDVLPEREWDQRYERLLYAELRGQMDRHQMRSLQKWPIARLTGGAA